MPHLDGADRTEDIREPKIKHPYTLFAPFGLNQYTMSKR